MERNSYVFTGPEMVLIKKLNLKTSLEEKLIEYLSIKRATDSSKVSISPIKAGVIINVLLGAILFYGITLISVAFDWSPVLGAVSSYVPIPTVLNILSFTTGVVMVCCLVFCLGGLYHLSDKKDVISMNNIKLLTSKGNPLRAGIMKAIWGILLIGLISNGHFVITVIHAVVLIMLYRLPSTTKKVFNELIDTLDHSDSVEDFVLLLETEVIDKAPVKKESAFQQKMKEMMEQAEAQRNELNKRR